MHYIKFAAMHGNFANTILYMLPIIYNLRHHLSGYLWHKSIETAQIFNQVHVASVRT